MKKLAIIGGGFAGLWAACSAVRNARLLAKENEVEITLINKDPYHCIRPRLYEAQLDSMRLLLADYLEPLGVVLVIDEVEAIDSKQHIIKLQKNADVTYDKLILATGSKLVIPDITGFKEYAFNIDTFSAATRLQQHFNELMTEIISASQYTVVVAGGGFTGVEAATEFMDRLNQMTPKDITPRVIVVDHHQVAAGLGQAMQQVVLAAFAEMNIEVLSNTAITAITKDSITLSDGQVLASNTLIWTAGMRANTLTQQLGGALDNLGRLSVDNYLRVIGVEDCFAAGDVAAASTDGTNTALQSCQHAIPQGRFVGHNAIASLFDTELLAYEQSKYVTCLDLGSWGAIYAETWAREVLSTKSEAKKIKQFINCDRIYPPNVKEQGITALLDRAEPAFKPIAT